MSFLFLESFFSGSHKDFALGLVEHSKYRIDLLTLPGKFWKWRMKVAALEFLQQVDDLSQYRAILVTDMINLSDLKAIAKGPVPPLVFYFHENQLTYPVSSKQGLDSNLGFINITSALVAQKILFNSYFHFNQFILALERVIKQMPEKRAYWIKDQIIKKTQVVYPGCRFPSGLQKISKIKKKIPLIVWNHRWEYDKNPEDFFKAIRLLKQKKIEFHLALLGEEQDVILKSFLKAKKEFKNEILIFGYVENKEDYKNWLKRGDIVVSTSIQENFGISIVEAIRMGCIPLLPKRLSYPEIIPEKYHSKVLYSSQKEFIYKLEHMVSDVSGFAVLQEELSNHMARFAWENMIEQYDKILENL